MAASAESSLSISEKSREDTWRFEVVDGGDTLLTIKAHGKVKQVCRRSLYVFSIHGKLRQKVILLVEWWWFDKTILLLILTNSVLLALIEMREDDDVGYNYFFNKIADPAFTGLFVLESLLKVIALGLIKEPRTYLRDPWNCLDFMVVLTSLFASLPGLDTNFGTLRVFRVLRPLRGLSAVPQLKVLVRTMINCIPKLGSVAGLGGLIFGVFAIVGIMLFDGIWYRRCRTIAVPQLLRPDGNASSECWSWPYAEGETRYCGGRYMCEVSGGFCGGHDLDSNMAFRPSFPDGVRSARWCPGSEPQKLGLPVAGFVHFDHLGGALLTIFQCMTLEGWTTIAFNVLDASIFEAGVMFYFLLLISAVSFFLVNIALATIDGVFADERQRANVEDEESFHPMRMVRRSLLRCWSRCRRKRSDTTDSLAAVEEEYSDDDSDDHEADRELWLDVPLVRFVHWIAFSQPFVALVLFLITANVVLMMLEQFPPKVLWLDFLETGDRALLYAFTIEMALMLVAVGPWRYATRLLYLFDGCVVVTSWAEVLFGTSSYFRGFRALRVMLKLKKSAKNWPKLDVLMKAMWATAKALRYWMVLFVLALYISTLMGMMCFANVFHFDEETGEAIAPGAHWCPNTEGLPPGFRQDCIPRAHFDTFLWAFVTVFSIMTGENWNFVMYDGMRAGGWLFASYFIWLIVFGKILVLSLFLSVLMSRFNAARSQMEEKLAMARRLRRQAMLDLPPQTTLQIIAAWGQSAKEAAFRTQQSFVSSSSILSRLWCSSASSWEGGEEEEPGGIKRERSASPKARPVPLASPGGRRGPFRSSLTSTERPMSPAASPKKEGSAWVPPVSSFAHVAWSENQEANWPLRPPSSPISPFWEGRKDVLMGKIASLGSRPKTPQPEPALLLVPVDSDKINETTMGSPKARSPRLPVKSPPTLPPLMGEFRRAAHSPPSLIEDMSAVNVPDLPSLDTGSASPLSRPNSSLSVRHIQSSTSLQPLRRPNRRPDTATSIASIEPVLAGEERLPASSPGRSPKTPGIEEEQIAPQASQASVIPSSGRASILAASFLEVLAKGSAEKAEKQAELEENKDQEDESSSSEDQSFVDKIPSMPREGWRRTVHGCVVSQKKLQRGFRWLLNVEAPIWGGDKVRVAETVVFVCIALSTVCSIFDNPLTDPDTLEALLVRIADAFFTAIFTVEIVAKLFALGFRIFFNGPDKLWNRLDAFVVAASLLGHMGSSGGSIFKTMRIVRAVRPLRIISRAPTLRIVIQTVLASLPGLVTLVLVSLFCMLIFSLLNLSIYSGRLYHCDNPDGVSLALGRNMGQNFTTPMCFRPDLEDFSEQWGSADVACQNGFFRPESKDWLTSLGCPVKTCGANLTLSWHRASTDTPICIGRCDPFEPAEQMSPERRRLCPRRFESLEELPSSCPTGTSRDLPPWRLEQEAVGQRYVNAMQREFVMPCGGSSPGEPEPTFPAAAISCRAAFCNNTVTVEREEQCRTQCLRHPHFCVTECTSHGSDSPSCRSCRAECEAACQCQEFCEPLVRDAALCHEQGLRWKQRVSQNFDNFANSMLSLFEISTTEGWTELMYAAADATEPYVEPIRDHADRTAAFIFCSYIFATYVFLLSLSVGLIVDNFMVLKVRFGGSKNSALMLTETQRRWVESRRALFRRKQLFNLSNLHMLTQFRRAVYDFVYSKAFENALIFVIVINISCLALKIFPSHMEHWPELQKHWNSTLEVINLLTGSVFIMEFLLKFYALRSHYWKDNMNVYDFICLCASIIGLVISSRNRVGGSMIGNSMRISRCVRIIGYFKDLQRLFQALLLTLPKFANVIFTFILLLTMYAILGTSLFATSMYSDEELKANGSFRNFFWSFLTLFRSSTGEAWNEIMHDLSKSEQRHLREGRWCTPHDMFDTGNSHVWNVLNSKCLIENPNACPPFTWLPDGMLPVLFWVSFTLIMTFLFMNLMLAVIIDSYHDTKRCPETEIIDVCIEKWKKFDADQRASLPLSKVFLFLHEVVVDTLHANVDMPQPDTGVSSLTMRHAQAFSMNVMADGRVHYLSAFQQVFRLLCLEGNLDLITELDASEGLLSKKEAARLRRKEKQKGGASAAAVELRMQIAVVKLQRHFRLRKARRLREQQEEEDRSRASSQADEALPESHGGEMCKWISESPPSAATSSVEDLPERFRGEGDETKVELPGTVPAVPPVVELQAPHLAPSNWVRSKAPLPKLKNPRRQRVSEVDLHLEDMDLPADLAALKIEDIPKRLSLSQE